MPDPTFVALSGPATRRALPRDHHEPAHRPLLKQPQRLCDAGRATPLVLVRGNGSLESPVPRTTLAWYFS
jgi:hypothetical protein